MGIPACLPLTTKSTTMIQQASPTVAKTNRRTFLSQAGSALAAGAIGFPLLVLCSGVERPGPAGSQ